MKDTSDLSAAIDLIVKRMRAGVSKEDAFREAEEAVMKDLTEDEITWLAEEAPPEGGVLLKIPKTEVTDIGEFCVDCRDPVDERYPKFASRRPVIREGEGEDGKALKGFLCEDCQPLEGTLMQPLVEALVERRWDEGVVKERMRVVGVEDIYEKVVGPTLDLLEMLLRLER